MLIKRELKMLNFKSNKNGGNNVRNGKDCQHSTVNYSRRYAHIGWGKTMKMSKILFLFKLKTDFI